MYRRVHKRDPIVVVKPFDYRNKNYEIGDLFDLRVIKIQNGRLHHFLMNGNLKLCKELSKEELGSYGYEMVTHGTLYPVRKIEKPKTKLVKSPKNVKKIKKDLDIMS